MLECLVFSFDAGTLVNLIAFVIFSVFLFGVTMETEAILRVSVLHEMLLEIR